MVFPARAAAIVISSINDEGFFCLHSMGLFNRCRATGTRSILRCAAFARLAAESAVSSAAVTVVRVGVPWWALYAGGGGSATENKHPMFANKRWHVTTELLRMERHSTMSPCLRVPLSPCPPVSVSPCLRVPLSPPAVVPRTCTQSIHRELRCQLKMGTPGRSTQNSTYCR